jgi:hypothetical protein
MLRRNSIATTAIQRAVFPEIQLNFCDSARADLALADQA